VSIPLGTYGLVQFAKHGFSLNVLTASLLSSWPTGRRTPAPLIRPLPCPRLASRMRKAGIVSRWTTMLVGASAVGLSLIGIVPIVGGARQRSDHRCRTRRVHHLSEPAVRADSRLIRPGAPRDALRLIDEINGRLHTKTGVGYCFADRAAEQPIQEILP
jgi:hypothetical protein